MFLDADFLRLKFGQGMVYGDFVASGETEGHRPPWDDRYGKLALDDAQAELVGGFTRDMNVLCLTGTWCGDCALQGSAMTRVAEANPGRIHLRYLPRHEEHADLITKAPINAGFRVPVTWMLSEDFDTVSVFGDRTLSRYRSIALNQLGDAAHVLAPAPADPVREVLREVLELFERAQLLLRLSPRLRQRHGD